MSEEETVDGLDPSSPRQPHYRTIDDERLTADEMDEKRQQNMAYEYLCHLEEAKVWIEACINEELPPTTELEEGLRNGVLLAKLGNFFAPKTVPVKRIYDKDQSKYQSRGLHFRHTDNINHWFAAMIEVGLPKIFYPETTDIYDRKNMPRAIYCIHALSLYLFKLGLAPQIQDLYGKVNFTEEEISAMRRELEKYGIQMPAFSKIGGILANEMPIDEAALHAAIIAINEAIDKQVAEDTMNALKNPAAMLVNLTPEGCQDYQSVLYEAKHTKLENARNKSIDPDSTYEPDIYDEILTQAEIQGNIYKVNTSVSLNRLNEALDKNDKALLLEALQSPHLGLKYVTADNIEFYLQKLMDLREVKKNNNNGGEVILDKDEIQQGVSQANLEADVEYQKEQAVIVINAAIEGKDEAQLMKAMQNPNSRLPEAHAFASSLYLEEFTNMRNEKESNLDYDEIFGGVTVLSAVALINKAVDSGDPSGTFTALSRAEAHIANLDADNAQRYQKHLSAEKEHKAGSSCDLLTHREIITGVDQVNQQVVEEHERIVAIGAINEAIDKGDPMITLQTLQMPSAKLHNVNEKEAIHYQAILDQEKKKKQEQTKDEAAVLWLEEIQAAIEKANKDAEDAKKLSAVVYAVNQSVDAADREALQSSLTHSDIYLHSVTPECTDTYMENLQALKKEKSEAGETGSGWMMNKTKEGHKFFYNVHTGDYSWGKDDSIVKDFSLLTREDVQGVVSEVTAAYDRELLFKSNEPFITKVQALWRGHKARKEYSERMNFIKNQEPAITKLQAWWRGQKQRQKYKDRMGVLHGNEDAVIKLQSMVRMWLARKKHRERLQYFKDNEDSIVKMQAFVRSAMAKQDYKALMHDENPSLSVVRKFVHLLDTNDVDYAEELELQKLRQQAVSEIRSNQQLEHDLDQMDIKIGLLIKNRITLQDVVTHNRKLAKQREKSGSVPKGLKALSKESREKLEAYQHLFYLLQTNPSYLAKLIFEMPQSKTTKFMESVIYSLFNYGSNQREEYLLLKLFKTALEEEISSKVDKMTDIVTGNPMVVKMIVGFNRNQRGQNALRDMLNPLIKDVLEDKNLKINTNPVDVYKMWVNQTESQTGQASGLPYDVTTEQALKHEPVQKMIEQAIEQLKLATNKFLSTILNSMEKIPYGMRYMAKVMREALWKKFPMAPEKDVLKIIGNLIYYRYINSAIVAPDAFGIVEVSASKVLTNDQRRNLGSIAKILQFAASNKGFGGDSAHLSCLNNYIKESHEKFKQFFRNACEVEDPETKFNINQYTDVTMVTKPIIYMSTQEICDTHQLLLEHQEVITTDNSDPLHELLEDLGDAPSITALMGSDTMDMEELDESVKAQLGKTEITLTLTNKFEVPDDDQSDLKSLLIKTKRLTVDVIACQTGENLSTVLNTPATDEQEELHQALVKRRDLRDKKAASTSTDESKLIRQPSISGENRLPLDMMKSKISKNLESLEAASIVSRKNHYQDLLNMIVQDIRNQRRYRNNRKQELVKLRTTLKSLSEKRTFYQDQIDYYNQYVKKCMENLQKKTNRKSKSFSLFKKDPEKAKKESVKYSAARLYDKGVVLEIEGVPHNQFKNVLFEIAATDDPGVFDVNAKFLGVEMHKVELVFQDLLQLQYEGVAVMKMFDTAKVNVNLLIFLLNRKFYGK